MTKRVKLSAALNRTLDQRAGVSLETDDDESALVPLRPERHTGANSNASAPRRRSLLAPVGRAMSAAVYGVGYYGSYGIAFSAMTLWYLLPLNNALGRGCRDGGGAGRDAAAHIWSDADEDLRSSLPEKRRARKRGGQPATA